MKLKMEGNQNEKNEIIEDDLEIKNLLEILTQTYSATSTHKIKEAEEKLKKFDLVIIKKLNKILIIQKKELSKNIIMFHHIIIKEQMQKKKWPNS